MKKSFQELIQSNETPVLVDFYADWCGPCKAMTPVIQNLAKEYKDKLKIIKIDVDKNPQVAAQYRVQGIPTFVLFDKGQVLWRKSGAMPPQDMKRELNPHLG